MDTDHLISRIEAYCKRYRISETTFGARALNNSKIVARLRAGGTVTLRSLRRMDAFMMGETAEGRQKEGAL